MRRLPYLLLPLLLLLLAACSPRGGAVPTLAVRPLPTGTVPAAAPAPAASTTPAALPDTAGLTLPPGFRASVLVEGLKGPTQMVLGPEGRLWVAQIAGGENEGVGQVVAISLETGASVTLAEGLFKPTGIAVLDDALWVAAGRDLLRAPLTLEADAGVGAFEMVLDDLPFNGRSNGTLTITPRGTLLYETSGARQGNAAAPGSATLWELDPAAPTAPRPLATGLKGAYAHTFDRQGRLWTTEIGDDPAGGGAPPDELNLVTEGANFGWPACFGDRQPAPEYSGNAEGCAATDRPSALFAPRSTPTSVVEAPWESGTLLVALWGPVEPRVVSLPIVDSGGHSAASAVEPFITGLELPQSLLALPDGSLLVSDFATGIIYRVERVEGS